MKHLPLIIAAIIIGFAIYLTAMKVMDRAETISENWKPPIITFKEIR